MWDCRSVEDIWGCGPCKIQKGVGGGFTFFHAVEKMLERCDFADVELLVVVAHTIAAAYG